MIHLIYTNDDAIMDENVGNAGSALLFSINCGRRFMRDNQKFFVETLDIKNVLGGQFEQLVRDCPLSYLPEAFTISSMLERRLFKEIAYHVGYMRDVHNFYVTSSEHTLNIFRVMVKECHLPHELFRFYVKLSANNGAIVPVEIDKDGRFYAGTAQVLHDTFPNRSLMSRLL